jgi:hypothetical protein
LSNHSRIDIHHTPPFLQEKDYHSIEEPEALDTVIAFVRIRKVRSDIPQPGRAEEGIAQSVSEDIGIGIPEEPFRIRNPHSTEDKRAFRHQTVKIEPQADTALSD